MTLLIYWTLLYVHGLSAGWYAVGLGAWIIHLMAEPRVGVEIRALREQLEQLRENPT